MEVVVWMLDVGGVSVVVLDLAGLVKLRRLVMRLICHVFDLMMGGGGGRD